MKFRSIKDLKNEMLAVARGERKAPADAGKDSVEPYHGTTHITPADGNVFLDLGFEPEEAAALKAESDRVISESLARMQAAPRFFAQEEWNALGSYKGQVVSGDPEGRVPEDLEADDNE